MTDEVFYLLLTILVADCYEPADVFAHVVCYYNSVVVNTDARKIEKRRKDYVNSFVIIAGTRYYWWEGGIILNHNIEQ